MPRSDEPKRFAIVDDDEDVRRALDRLLTAFGHDVAVYASADELLAGTMDVDCLILDLSLPTENGLQFTARLRAMGSRLPIVLMSAYDEASMFDAARRAGVPLLQKPFDEAALHAAVARACAAVQAS